MQNSDLRLALSVDVPFVHPTVVFRASVFRAGFKYPENTIKYEDLSFWCILAEKSFVFHNLEVAVLRYTLSSATLARRSGFRKSLGELSTRVRFLGAVYPFRAHLFVFSFCIFISKVVFPVSAYGRLSKLRSRFLNNILA